MTVDNGVDPDAPVDYDLTKNAAEALAASQETEKQRIRDFATQLTGKYGELSDRELLLMVVGWQLNANQQIAGLVEQGKKLMANPMVASMMGMLD